ncbi:MAG: phenylphosphate carboxylase subunit delta [Phycisphaerales bacterium]|nr:phenylphosphate carboxylase subunit delta [Phycisphaerales bacterium]
MTSDPDWSAVRAIVMDIDGTLTDGGIHINDSGEESKRYDVRDGFGLTLWHKSGGKSGVITGRRGLALMHRMRELAISAVEQGASDKVAALDRITARLGVTRTECIFVGDDIPDLAVMRQVGFAVAVNDAAAEVRAGAHFVTSARGGAGAVREVVEKVLRAQARWDALIALV